MQNRNERAGRLARVALLVFVAVAAVMPLRGSAQMTTTTVQGTVYRADGTPAGGTLLISWPAFTTAQNEAVAAGNLNAAIGANGFVSVDLTPNAGALPSGSYYTATYHLNDGTVNQEFWVVPAAGTATVAAVRAQLQPATVAVPQAATSTYVQNAIASLSGTYVPLTGGTMSGALMLSGDPTGASQAATKHYADQLAAQNVPLSGGSLTGPLTVPSLTVAGNLSAALATSDLGRTARVSVRECGAMGNSIVGTDGNDDTGAIRACVAKLCGEGGGTLFFPAGTYRTSSNIQLTCAGTSLPGYLNGSGNNPMIRLGGDSVLGSTVVMTEPTQPLFSVQGDVQVTIDHLSLFGLGTATTGTLLESFGVWLRLDHVTFNGTGGIAFLQDGERAYLDDVRFQNVRQAWVQGAAATNESYGYNTEALNFGYTENPFTHSGGFSYDINATNGVNPSSGTVAQNMRAGFVLAGNGVNVKLEGCSIKGANDISAVRVIHGENVEISHCYFEGWTASAPAGIGENLSIIRGGYDMTAAATGAITSTTIPISPTNSTAIHAWSVALTTSQAMWFRNQVGFANELSESVGDACSGSLCYAGVILPPDYIAGSSAPSSIGGGILKGNYEQVELYGVVGSTLYVRSRGYNGTTQYNWPSGAVYIESDGQSKFPSDMLHLVDNHYEAYHPSASFSITANPNCGEPNGAEIELGWMPDCYGFFTNANPANVGIDFSGNNRFRSAKMETHDIGSVYVEGQGSEWPSVNANFDIPVGNMGMGGLQDTFVTYSDGSKSRAVGCISGGCFDTNFWTGIGPSAAVGFREYFWPTLGNTPGEIHQFLGSTYNICDAFGTGYDPAFCNVLDAGGVWKRVGYNNGAWNPLGGYITTDPNGNASVAGHLLVQGTLTGATINGEVTVDGTTYTTLNAAWNAAVSQANSSGQNQTVRLGPGTYPVTATLMEPTNGACVNLLGSGGTTMNADSNQVATTLSVPNALNGDVFFLGNASQAQGCTFRDFNVLAGSHATHGFELQWFRGLLIENVAINDTTAEGMVLGEEDTSAGHQSSFLVRNVTVSYSSAAFTPANRPAYGVHLEKTAMDSELHGVTVRNALTAAVYNEGTGNTGYLIHGFGYPYTCTTAPCANNASSGSAANASYATNYVIYDVGGGGSVWTDTFVDSPATAGFYIGANGVEIHGGHVQWPDVTSFPTANLATVAAGVSNNLLIADVDCLAMAPGVNWITYAGTSGNPPTYASVHHLTGCGNYYQSLEPANTTGFSSGGANINDPSGAVPRVWSTPVASAASYPAYSAQMYTGYQGDAFQAHFSGVSPFFNVTYQGTIRTNGGIALSAVTNTASTLTLTAANKNVIANASSGAQTITLPSCYTALPDRAAPTGLEFTIIKSDTSSNTVTVATSSSQLIYSQGVGASALVLSGPSTQTLVCGPDYNWYVAGSTAASSSTPHMTWGGSFAGTFGTSLNMSLGAIWTPSAGISMARLDVAVGTAPAGCTTWPVVGIYDGTAAAWLKTVTLASGTYSYRNAVSAVAIPAGHNLSMGVQTAGAGCTTNAGSAQLTMEYTMQ